MKRALILFAGVGAAVATGVLAGTGRLQEGKAQATGASGYNVDPVHSSVVFKVLHQGVAPFYGRFNEVSGTFLIDPENVSHSSINVTIPAASVDTHNKGRDEHLRKPDFFSAAEFPTITFKSTSFTKTGDKTYDVAGDLTMRGTTRPVTAKLTYGGTAKGMRGGEVSGFEATATIKRSEFGVSYMVGPSLGDDVTIILALEGGRQ